MSARGADAVRKLVRRGLRKDETVITQYRRWSFSTSSSNESSSDCASGSFHLYECDELERLLGKA